MYPLRFTEHGILRVNTDRKIDDIVTAIQGVVVYTGVVPVWVGASRIIVSPEDSQDEIERKVASALKMLP